MSKQLCFLPWLAQGYIQYSLLCVLFMMFGAALSSSSFLPSCQTVCREYALFVSACLLLKSLGWKQGVCCERHLDLHNRICKQPDLNSIASHKMTSTISERSLENKKQIIPKFFLPKHVDDTSSLLLLEMETIS